MKRIIAIMMAVVLCMAPISARAADDRPSDEVMWHEDWTWDNLSTSAPGFNEVFKATVAFKPTNVSAVAGKNNIHVYADCNTAVRTVFIEWSTDKRFWYSEGEQFYRNVNYKAPVLVTRKSQQKYWSDGHYSSSNILTYTQGRKTLWSKKIYHPRDQWGYQEPTQATVDAVRRKISFRKSFLIRNVEESRCGCYYVRITYYYTSVTCGVGIKSKSVTVKVR